MERLHDKKVCPEKKGGRTNIHWNGIERIYIWNMEYGIVQDILDATSRLLDSIPVEVGSDIPL